MSEPRAMTKAQNDVLLALNLVQMANEDAPEENGYTAREVGAICGRSTRSAAVVLSQMRDFGWVRSLHSDEMVGWFLTVEGVAALERDRGRTLR